MKRRDMLVASVGLATTGATRAIGASEAMPGMKMNLTMGDCIELCLASQRSCLETATQLAQRTDSKPFTRLFAMLSDCAELCSTTANSMMRQSPLHPLVCRACAEACEYCTKECREFVDDPLLQRCAATCVKCASGCREMAAMAIQ